MKRPRQMVDTEYFICGVFDFGKKGFPNRCGLLPLVIMKPMSASSCVLYEK